MNVYVPIEMYLIICYGLLRAQCTLNKWSSRKTKDVIGKITRIREISVLNACICIRAVGDGKRKKTLSKFQSNSQAMRISARLVFELRTFSIFSTRNEVNALQLTEFLSKVK